MWDISSYGCLRLQITKFPQTEAFSRFESGYGLASVWRSSELGSCKHFGGVTQPFASRYMSTEAPSVDSSSQDSLIPEPEVPPRIKFKRLDKTGRHIMQASDCSGLLFNKNFIFFHFVKMVGIYIL